MIEKRSLNRWKSNAFAWFLLLPSFLFLSMFTFFPIFKTLRMSFYQSDLTTPIPLFVGIGNYLDVIKDPVFWKVMHNNLWFMIGTVPTSMIIGLIMALFTNKLLRGNGWIRTAFFYPNVIPMIAIANIWLFIYTPKYGLLALMLKWVGQEDLNVLGSPQWVMLAMIVMIVWREAGYFMIFYLAGLQNISKELYEAADIDGVSRWKVFSRITFPLLMPTTLFVMIIAFNNSFKLVDHLYIMSDGGPNNASNLLMYYIYQQAFRFWDMGMASTLTVVMVALLLLLAGLQFFSLDKRIHYH